jgi:hypothetical protein
MRCIFLDGGNCKAIPPNVGNLYKPDEKEKTDFCNSNKFEQCPRFIAIIDYLKAISKPSP